MQFLTDSNSEKTTEVQVEYQSKPLSCSNCKTCKTFGHSLYKCPRANFKWVPKVVPIDKIVTVPTSFNLTHSDDGNTLNDVGAKHHDASNDGNTLKDEWTVVGKGSKPLTP